MTTNGSTFGTPEIAVNFKSNKYYACQQPGMEGWERFYEKRKRSIDIL